MWSKRSSIADHETTIQITQGVGSALAQWCSRITTAPGQIFNCGNIPQKYGDKVIKHKSLNYVNHNLSSTLLTLFNANLNDSITLVFYFTQAINVIFFIIYIV